MSDTREADGNGEKQGWRDRLWRIIFLSDTKVGQAFDVVLLFLIGGSVLVVMLDSVESLRNEYRSLFLGLEWVFTFVFTIEYVVRLMIVRKRRKYALSFFGIVDLISILPTYVAFLFSGSHYLMVIRILRLLRMFRVLKMAHHFGQSNLLLNSLRSSGPKISVFLFFILILVSIEGTLMYLAESPGRLRLSRMRAGRVFASQSSWRVPGAEGREVSRVVPAIFSAEARALSKSPFDASATTL